MAPLSTYALPARQWQDEALRLHETNVQRKTSNGAYQTVFDAYLPHSGQRAHITHFHSDRKAQNQLTTTITIQHYS